MSIITADQSRKARRELGLSQAVVAESTGLNRQYISEFESGYTNRLTNAHLRKLRSFYEAKIEEARDAGEEIEVEFGAVTKAARSVAKVEAFTAKRCVFPVADDVSDEVLASTFGAIANNDKRLADLLCTVAARDDGIFGDGELTPDTISALRESFSLLAANYLLIRTVGGWPEIGLSAANVSLSADTVLASIIAEASPAFELAGLIGKKSANDENEDEVFA